MRRTRHALLVLALLTVPLSGCLEEDRRDSNEGGVVGAGGDADGSDGPAGETVGETIDRWSAEATARGPGGVPARVSVSGDELSLLGNLTAGASGFDVTLRVPDVFPAGTPLVYVNGTVDGLGEGVLVLEGPTLSLSGAELTARLDRVVANDSVTAFLLTAPQDEPDPLDATFPEAWSEAERSIFFSTWYPVALTAVAVGGHERALFVPRTGPASEPAGPFVVTAPGLRAENGAALLAPVLELEAPSFAMAVVNASGAVLSLDNGHGAEAPSSVFGHEATLEVRPGHVSSIGPMRWTQATTEDGLALPAAIELRTERDIVEVPYNGTTWVQVHYREASFVGAAVLANVTVTGPGAEMVSVPLAPAPWLVEALWNLVVEAYPALLTPFALLPIAVASPFLLVAEVLLCGLAGCPEKHPYPVWMEPGETGRFYFRVNGSVPQGTHQATLTFEGVNHEALVVPLTIRVTPPVPA